MIQNTSRKYNSIASSISNIIHDLKLMHSNKQQNVQLKFENPVLPILKMACHYF